MISSFLYILIKNTADLVPMKDTCTPALELFEKKKKHRPSWQRKNFFTPKQILWWACHIISHVSKPVAPATGAGSFASLWIKYGGTGPCIFIHKYYYSQVFSEYSEFVFSFHSYKNGVRLHMNHLNGRKSTGPSGREKVFFTPKQILHKHVTSPLIF